MRQRTITLFLAVLCICLLAACSETEDVSQTASDQASPSGEATDEAAYRKITAVEAKDMIDDGNVTVVDVRGDEEYASGHIPGAILTPNESIGEEQPPNLPEKDEVLLVYCRTGVRSKEAAHKLLNLGYTQVYDLGGIVDWPYDIEGGEDDEQ